MLQSLQTSQEAAILRVVRGGETNDTWVIERLWGHEEAARPYCFNVELRSISSVIALAEYVGKPMTIAFDYGQRSRYFSGIVGEIEQGLTVSDDGIPYTKYRLKIYPTLWFLKFTQDCQIFQNKSALEIVKQVLDDNGVKSLQDKTTTCGKTVREYCVQYRETAFNFISRLMEEEGIFYYFEHSEEGETMILTDDSLESPKASEEPLEVLKGLADQANFNNILSLTISHQIVSNEFSQADYNFETASVKLYNKAPGAGDGGRIYDYPGIYRVMDDGDSLATNRIQELEWFKRTVKGESTCPLLTPLNSMEVTGHPTFEGNGSFVIYKVFHDLNVINPKRDLYRNSYEAFPANVPFRAPMLTPKPVIPSTQTAKVTGKVGEEIWCDEYGRIKVKFHWDQSDIYDDKSSCWIRVAQLWASSGWGGLWTPRIGMEVVVTFLEGDPDRPLITGCVYNSDNMPPYAADEPTKSTIRSDSTKGHAGFNEFRFEDKKGEEEIFTHAQKDKNSIVEDNRTLRINDGDDTTDIMAGDRTVTLHAETRKGKSAGRGNDKLTLTKGCRSIYLEAAGDKDGDHLLELTRGKSTLHIIKGNHNILLDTGNQSFTVVGSFVGNYSKDYSLVIGGSLSIVVSGAISISSGGDMDISSGGNIKMSAGGDVSISAGANFKAVAGGSGLVSAAGVLDLKGAVINLN